MRAREGRRALPPELARLRRRMALASSALMALVLAVSLAGAWLWSARGYASEADVALQQAAGEPPLDGDGPAAVAVAGPYPVVRLSLAGGSAADATGTLSGADAAALASEAYPRADQSHAPANDAASTRAMRAEEIGRAHV